MILVADIGNTHTVLGLHDGGDWRKHWRVTTDKERTVDEWSLTLHGLFAMEGLPVSGIADAAICSVVPTATSALRDALRRLGKDPVVVGPGVRTGLAIRHENPKEIGADRIVNAVAASSRYKTACIVVDFGTATTFDCITAEPAYIGGVICPGVGISQEALVRRTAKLPKVALMRPPRVIGKTTEHAIQSGLLHGYAAMVDGLIARIREEMGTAATVVATGGLAAVIAAETAHIPLENVDPNLTLDGIRIVLHRHRKPR